MLRYWIWRRLCLSVRIRWYRESKKITFAGNGTNLAAAVSRWM
ncbi:hypothetical protein GCM10010256_77770 [Streptomyces coeruleorubidus]|nr:hypothetical protein GCM10010256_77770 [Streptomyces coeruleorubidus]